MPHDTVLTGSVQHRPDAVMLHAYAGLCYAPHQHGEGVRFAHNGKPVQDVEVHAGLTDEIQGIADQLGVSFGDVCDALKYLRDQNQI